MIENASKYLIIKNNNKIIINIMIKKNICCQVGLEFLSKFEKRIKCWIKIYSKIIDNETGDSELLLYK